MRATCADLREKLSGLPSLDPDEVVTIQVTGEIASAHRDDAVAYLVVCRPPDPQVACITYETDDRQVGDRVVVAGAYTAGQLNRIVLDPCLHFAAPAAE